MPASVSKGDLYELRICRMLFWEGAFVRRAINLNVHFGEQFTVTDIDVLALRFAPNLELQITIGEAKTTTASSAPKATDRLLWGGGLRALVGADGNFVATTKPASERVRRLAASLGGELLDEQDIAHREALLGIDSSTSWGPYHPDLLLAQQGTLSTIKDDADLKRVYWFLRSNFWFEQPVPGLKRALGACRMLAGRYSDQLSDAERKALKWLAHQAIAVTTVALARIAAVSYRQPPTVARARLTEQLAEGLADYHTLSEISRTVDRYVMGVLREANVDPGRVVSALGALSPAPPAYTEPLLEVVERLAAEPAATSQLPRTVDWLIAEAELGARQGKMPASTVEVLEGDTERLLRTVGVFLTGQTKLPHQLTEGVLRLPNGTQRPRASDSAELSTSTISRGPGPEVPATRAEPAASAVRSELFPAVAPEHDGDLPVVRPGDPRKFRLGNVAYAEKDGQPVAVRAVALIVVNVGDQPAEITDASARSEHHGELIFERSIQVPPGGEGQLAFRMTAPTSSEGLHPGERVDVAMRYDGNHQSEFAARWIGPGPEAWELINGS
jgi:hypothetical protein